MTPTLARVVAAHEREFKKPLKWFSIPQCFRYEKQQRGRLREHFQINCDIIGDDSLGADVETIALCIDLLRAFGLSEKDFVVRISDRRFWIDLLQQEKIPEERWDEMLQAIDKSEREPREKTAEKLGSLSKAVFAILDGGGKSEKLEQVADGLRARGLEAFVKIDLGIVRGLAYYTGIVFEAFDRAGKFRALAGGGRYDNLIAQLSDNSCFVAGGWFCHGRRRSGRIDCSDSGGTRKGRDGKCAQPQHRCLPCRSERRTATGRARAAANAARSKISRRFRDDAGQSR